ncbi:membrane-bound lytic murein transglycosylase [Gluconacetobacter johannae DSM 13595]|uniref:peptidoglycan lytic exotransglycosylase n=2 Tax=Gluconacetobacter johannae TaxID=112140 RepID=A0A7W4P3Z9_9PROT|nr:murein transglycosylase A [Gluconacetobacter johannae]MBB2174538.1 murein transglycosylase A [Gluconacetobacter johannae]GBQ84482.1 membrane-bound lytic murein transglycosylase [Gluconacetobacter johannae DSM 13595]
MSHTLISKILRGAGAAAIALLSACAMQTEGGHQPVAFSDLQGWGADAAQQSLPVFLTECHHLGRLPADATLGADSGPGAHVGDWLPACRAATALPTGDAQAARAFYERWFQPVQAGDGSTLFTGYYEPEIRGALSRGGVYQTPVYRVPDDLVRTRATDGRMVTGRWQGGQFVPYWSRAQIDAGVLSGRNLELLWVADPADLFFLQIQGSGRVRLPSGQVARLGFGGKNGLEYVPLGRVLVRDGAMAEDDVSMQSIRAWLTAHPGEARATMEENPNYVFFTMLDNVYVDQGAPGAMGVPLSPGQSAAIDRKIIPLGAPIWVETDLPGPSAAAWRRLVFAQDIGTDIQGASRADLFLGWGADAEQTAGRLRQRGRMVVFLPRPVVTRSESGGS